MAENKVKFCGEVVEGFTQAYLMSKFDDPVPTPEFHRELWDLFCDPHPRVAIAAPRGHAKSTAGTHSFGLAALCFRQRSHILIVSDTESQAVDFLRDIRNELVENELLIEHFGIEGLTKDNEKEIIGRFKDGAYFRVIAKGSEQKMRGIKWRNKRPDLILGDDLENDEIVMNDERRAKFELWFLKALLPCVSKRGVVRVVGTILHLDSMLENRMPPLNHPCTKTDGLREWWDEEAYKEYCKELKKDYKPRAWKSFRYRAHTSPNDFSQILWPEQFNKERLTRTRNEYIEQGFPEGYSQEYLNYPIDDENAYFKAADFKPIPDDLRDTPLTMYGAADLAISVKDSRAYTVLVAAGMDARGYLHVKDVLRFRGDAREILDRMFAFHEQHDFDLFFVEQENIARTLDALIKEEEVERGVYLPIEPMTASQDKIKRARPLQARLRSHKILFDQDTGWYADLYNEMTQFPRGKYMDQVDSLAWIPLGLEKIINAPTQQEYADMLYEEEYEESMNYQELGASSVTGY